MPLALCALSHSPAMGINPVASEVSEAVDAALEDARQFVAEFDPELVIMFGPDHFNGFFYDMMPPFCLGRTAQALGDFDTLAGPLNVEYDTATAVAREILDSGIDVAISERMHVDHGFAQPLGLIFGSLDTPPLVPIFINCVAQPFGPVKRARLLGEAAGRAAISTGKRVLIMGSGGLSHDPPVPTLEGAAPAVAERLIDGRNPTPEQRALRQQAALKAGMDLAAGAGTIQELNPEWDRQVLAMLADGDLETFDSWTTESFTELAGHSSHETRNWIATYAALSAAGPYRVLSSFYRPIPEWIAGFGVTTALPLAP
ncbi:3-carboxyethylcatechol 2,3-dioxygenase [Okibacterium endophyticum]